MNNEKDLFLRHFEVLISININKKIIDELYLIQDTPDKGIELELGIPPNNVPLKKNENIVNKNFTKKHLRRNCRDI